MSRAFAAHRRRVATATGLLLLLAQLLGAAHAHPSAATASAAAVAVPVASEPGACPICVYALHAPLTVASPPWVAGAESAVGATVEPSTRSCALVALDAPHGRAPPANT
jgi:hypothetical protein